MRRLWQAISGFFKYAGMVSTIRDLPWYWQLIVWAVALMVAAGSSVFDFVAQMPVPIQAVFIVSVCLLVFGLTGLVIERGQTFWAERRADPEQPTSQTQTAGEPERQERRRADEPQRLEDNRSVTSHNQMGGQTAFNITNEGPQPRRISQVAGDALIKELRKHPPEQFQISWMMDAESGKLGAVLQDILQKGGWQSIRTVPGAMLPNTPRGVIVETRIDSDAVDAVVEWLRNAGLNPHVNRGERRFGCITMGSSPSIHIVVGVLPQ